MEDGCPCEEPGIHLSFEESFAFVSYADRINQCNVFANAHALSLHCYRSLYVQSLRTYAFSTLILQAVFEDVSDIFVFPEIFGCQLCLVEMGRYFGELTMCVSTNISMR